MIMEKQQQLYQWIAQGERIAFWGASNLSQSLITDIICKYEAIDPICIFDNYCEKSDIRIAEKDIPVKRFLKSEYESGIKIILCVSSRDSYAEVCNIIQNAGFEKDKDYIDGFLIGTIDVIGTKDNPYETIRPAATYAAWRKDETFMDLFELVRANTLLDIYKCFSLWQLVKQSGKTGEEGDICEIGVWRGGSGALIASGVQRFKIASTVYLCDTFTGVVKTSERDGFYKGKEHADTSQKIVEQLVGKLNLHNVKIVKGVFPDEVMNHVINKRFRFVHIDVDVYISAKDVFRFIWPKVVLGGIVVFDDYGFKTTDGVTALVEELMESMKNAVCVTNLNGQAVFIKTS